MSERVTVALPATVEKIIRSPDPRESNKAQINIDDGADALYKEIRIENTLTDNKGKEVSLKKGREG